LTDSVFFDTDCLSAFLWTSSENLLVNLFPGKIIIPKPVYDEISCPSVQHLKLRVDSLVSNKLAKIETILTGTEVFNLYYQLTVLPGNDQIVIGKGEAASIALAKCNKGIVASNNMKDISFYVQQFQLKQITTGGILIEAMKKGFLNEKKGNSLWQMMLAKHRKLGATSFSDYLIIKGR